MNGLFRGQGKVTLPPLPIIDEVLILLSHSLDHLSNLPLVAAQAGLEIVHMRLILFYPLQQKLLHREAFKSHVFLQLLCEVELLLGNLLLEPDVLLLEVFFFAHDAIVAVVCNQLKLVRLLLQILEDFSHVGSQGRAGHRLSIHMASKAESSACLFLVELHVAFLFDRVHATHLASRVQRGGHIGRRWRHGRRFNASLAPY